LKLGASPGKLLVTGLLGIVFLAVLWYQFGDSGTPSATARRRPRSAARPNDSRPAAELQQGAEFLPPDSIPWDPIPLDEMLAHNPFRLPPALQTATPKQAAAGHATDAISTAEAEHRQQVVAQLQTKGVSMVFEQQGQMIAVVGDRQIRVGDVIDGLRVKEITSDGLVLEEPLIQ
jgi:hypothetical protein